MSIPRDNQKKNRVYKCDVYQLMRIMRREYDSNITKMSELALILD